MAEKNEAPEDQVPLLPNGKTPEPAEDTTTAVVAQPSSGPAPASTPDDGVTFVDTVMEFASNHDWHVITVPNDQGFPQNVFVRHETGKEGVIFAYLKNPGETLTDDETRTMNSIKVTGADCYHWYPSDFLSQVKAIFL